MDKEKRQYTEVYRRMRKMLLVVPVVMIPMLALAFFALGGGRGDNGAGSIALTKGLNMSLPDVRLGGKKKVLNKLGLYQQSEQDSMKIRASRKLDPYWNGGGTRSDSGRAVFGLSGLGPEGSGGSNARAAELLNKLDVLKGVLGRQEQGVLSGAELNDRGNERPAFSMGESARGRLGDDGALSPVVGSSGRMNGNGLRHPFGAGGADVGGPAVSPVGQAPGDSDLDKLNVLMDKVIRVRYPGDGALRDTVMAGRENRPVEVLTVPVQQNPMTTLPGGERDDGGGGFINMDDGEYADSIAGNMIVAVVDGAQTLVSGEGVSLRTAQEAVIGGVRVPGGTAVAGKASLSGERLLISVTSVRIGNEVRQVSMEVIDMDGMVGIRVKGSMNRDVSKEAADDVVGSVGSTSFDPTIAGQAASAGVQAARTLLSRKVRLVRVGLPAGYRVWLRNVKANR